MENKENKSIAETKKTILGSATFTGSSYWGDIKLNEYSIPVEINGHELYLQTVTTATKTEEELNMHSDDTQNITDSESNTLVKKISKNNLLDK